MTRTFSRLMVVLVVGAIFSAPASAHTGGSVAVAPKAIAPGAALNVAGKGLPKLAAVRVVLRSALSSVPLASPASDKDGNLALAVSIPAATRPGAYQLVLLASDGDILARADVEVHAAASAATAMEHAGMAMPDTASPHATADPMQLDVANGPFEWIVGGSLVGLSALFGGALLRRRAS